MKIIAEQILLDKPETITVEYIENSICQSGYKPLRWAIVVIKDNKLVVDTVVILD